MSKTTKIPPSYKRKILDLEVELAKLKVESFYWNIKGFLNLTSFTYFIISTFVGIKFFLYFKPVKFVFDMSPVENTPDDVEFKNLFCS